MCGVAGILGRIDEGNRSALARMSRAMAHRGPDGHGVWESAPDEGGWGVLLDHRRLAILDLSTTGAQPMQDTLTGDVLIFNGEIYNYLQLRDRLGTDGERVTSSGDTAVLLRALARHGKAALPWLRGMFAFAFWNVAERRLLLARDPLGIKPLYLLRNPEPRGSWSVAFASELRALLASGLIGTPRLHPGAIGSLVWNGFVVGPDTAVAGIELLEPGRMLEFDDRGHVVAQGQFWTFAPREAAPADETELAGVLQDGLRLHLASDVPLAVFLSAGIDSSAVANLARKVASEPIHTFTMAFAERDLNEGPYARRIAAALGSHHHEVVLTEADFLAHLEAALDSLDQPTFDGLNAYFLSRSIRNEGFKVALVGSGGDELFGGYTVFRDLPVLYRWARRTRWIPDDLLDAAASLGATPPWRGEGSLGPQTRWAKLPDLVRHRGDLKALYQLAYALFLPSFQREMLAPEVNDLLVNGLPRSTDQRLEHELLGRSPLSAISVLAHRLFLGERLLRDNDAASMASSIEQRVPLADQLVFQTADRLPDPQRFEPIGRKAILRRIGLRGLDPALFERPKSGFVLPFDRWLRRGLKPTIDATLRDPGAVRAAGLQPTAVARLWRTFLQGAPGLYWSRVWALYVLVRWSQRHGVRL
jgi:asparagine synthase (glutamine-hydrolysing)